MPRLLPYTDSSLCNLICAALSGVEVGTLVPATLPTDPRPFVLAHRVGGAATDFQFLDVPTIDLQAFTRHGGPLPSWPTMSGRCYSNLLPPAPHSPGATSCDSGKSPHRTTACEPTRFSLSQHG